MACAQLIKVAALLQPLKRAAVVPGRTEHLSIDVMIQHVENSFAQLLRIHQDSGARSILLWVSVVAHATVSTGRGRFQCRSWEDVVVAGRGVVVGDDRESVGGERPERTVIDATALPQAISGVAAAGLAVLSRCCR
jgi:hypothetical protein